MTDSPLIRTLKAVANHQMEVPFHLLRCNAALSGGEPESGNLLVQGDNLISAGVSIVR
jgi:site-specific DNA-methyltransferase (adenine-specific)/adenine-specific DNA-methyltransferase